jgi:NADH-quinone oxidoreductase subunit C
VSVALTRLRSDLADAVLSQHEQHGDATVVVAKDRLLEVLGFLHEQSDLDFDMLSDLTAVDHLERRGLDGGGAQRRDGDPPPRFEVVYHLYSIIHNHRLRVKVGIDLGDCEVESVVAIWPAANWMEREVFDLYGIRFSNHPDLRRILLYEEFEGHPLRKDYPKTRRQPLVGPVN